MSARQVVEADLTCTGRRFEPGIRIAVDEEGRIARVGRLDLTPTRHLPGVALLPGFVNAHSHAFQRGLRGKGESFPKGAGTFWTWREDMYSLVAGLDAASFRTLCVRAFGEMLDAGITTVGEFHYLHHSAAIADWSLDRVLLDAAREAGIRIVVLATYFRTGGIGQPLTGAQQRFDGVSLATYWQHLDRLAASLDRRCQHLGVAAHSVRAVTPEEIVSLANEARRRGLPLHLHMEEQPREIEECIASYGRRPLELLNAGLADAPTVTAVHCTHSTPDDLRSFVERGGRVCVCPLTEANLGDGIPDLSSVPRDRICLGTDSNARISMLEELRWLEYGQRLAGTTRGVLADRQGTLGSALLAIGTEGGADALGVAAGRIAPGAWADFAAVDLGTAALAGWTEATLADAIVAGADNEIVVAVAVGGRWLRRRGDEPQAA